MHVAVLALLLPAACRRSAAPVVAKADVVVDAPVAQEHSWKLAVFAADAALAEDQQLAELDAPHLTERLGKIVMALPQFATPTAADVVVDPVGVQVIATWQATDTEGKPAPILAPTGGGGLFVSAVAHAERIGVKPRDIAERTVEVMLPFPAERAGTLPEYVFERLRQAVALAVTDAVGELWARRLTDDQVKALVGKGPLWQQMAGAREVGERKLKDARVSLEKAARDTRKDLAAVAAAALGRLGDDQSTPVLVALLDTQHLEVIDAALGALADIGTPAALAALKDAAEHHEVPMIRARAKALLEK